MHIRTFRAANLNDALAMIRDQMGPEASVLHTRELPPSRFVPFGRKRIEVTAGLKPLRCSEPAAAVPAGPPAKAPAESESSEHRSPAGGSLATPQNPDGSCARSTTPLLPATSLLPAHPVSPARPVSPACPAALLVDELLDLGLPRRIAQRWAERAAPTPGAPTPGAPTPAAPGLVTGPPRSPNLLDAFAATPAQPLGKLAGGAGEESLEGARAALAQWLARSLRIGNPIEAGRGRRRVVALVGPTGVGKTTTIAKLAAGLQLQQSARVGLLTLDTFRAAAIEQLDAFARTLGVPLAVARTTSEVAGALEQLGEVELVLIDTVGQSPRGEQQIAAMERLLAAARPDETHLVVDANGSFGSAADVCAAFQPLQPTAAIISKLDEVRRPAPVIAAVLEGALQISYVTTGQRVPEDIATAGRESLAAAATGHFTTGLAAPWLSAAGLAATGLAATGLAATGLAATGLAPSRKAGNDLAATGWGA